MKVAVTANGEGLEAPFMPFFGRCPVFVFVDTETMACEWCVNPAMEAAGGAGIQAAQLVVDQGAAAVISGHIGPNAYQVLARAGVAVHTFGGGSVQQAVDAYKQGQLQPVTTPTGPAHAGMGRMGQGGGRGFGRGRGMGGR